VAVERRVRERKKVNLWKHNYGTDQYVYEIDSIDKNTFWNRMIKSIHEHTNPSAIEDCILIEMGKWHNVPPDFLMRVVRVILL